jgi:periplasmic protein TonB
MEGDAMLSVMLAMALQGVGVAAPPRPAAPGEPINRQGWITNGDYPREALANREQGTVDFELHIDNRSEVIECTVTRSSGFTVLDAATCMLVAERGRFEPAVNRRGRRIASVYRSRVRWQLPAN